MGLPRRLALATTALAPLLLLTPPAQATGAGYVTFAGFLSLYAPCNGGCNAWFNSTIAVGEVTSGTDLLVVTNLDASMSYSLPCHLLVPTAGEADGTMTLSGIGRSVDAGIHLTLVGTEAVITSGSGSGAVVGSAEVVPTFTSVECPYATHDYIVSGRIALA
jgi:hypothetical protein